MTDIVEVTQGSIRGHTRDGCRVFLGIPYAAAPVGDLRLQPPAPAPPWAGVRSADTPGPTAPKGPYPNPFQSLFNEPVVDGDEYLNLNVWTPHDADNAAVLVWIHGGAYVNGSGIVPQYDGAPFARDGIVCVTINYRLGAEGFLDLGDDVCNLGLRDQIAALQWIQNNIAAFGGDPDRVTIAGESAGGMSVTSLLSSPLAAGLFHRVIAQSGAGHHALSRPDGHRIATELASRLGVLTERSAIAAVPRQRLLEAQLSITRDMALNPDPAIWGGAVANSMAFEPVIDGEVLPALPIESITNGAGAGIDVLAGSNLHEQRLFLVPTGVYAASTEPAVHAILAARGIDATDAAAAYPEADTPGALLDAVLTDWTFRIPAIRLAEAVAGNGANAYMYQFGWESPLFDGLLRSCHFLEVPYVFDSLDAAGSAAQTGPQPDRDLARRMHSAWVSFIQDGDPGWSVYGERRTTKLFASTDDVLADPGAASRRLWEGRR
ncbi:carboxylesterase/lipase family protein [Cumulibacter soli]|uniref:carboxylesterase/lipase family protein n=1 Tax=Cumulibacter soli TaxID=2546344 RepID=UPI0010679B40|nr:carboxylesterase family protein [Cumulibacter soli]